MSAKLKRGVVVKPKKHCCKSGPRCKRCPVVLRRLEQRGFAEQRSDGTFAIVQVVPKSARKAARRR